MGLLEGKVALITGAARGIGKAIALKFAEEGADVAFTDLVINEAAEQTVAELEAFGHKVKAYASNAASFDETHAVVEEIKAAVKATMDEFGRVDILVNNAGGGPIYPIMETPDDFWQHGLDLELSGVFYCMREFGREMIKAGYGRIINNSSLFGRIGTGDIPISNYCAVKGGVVNLTREAAAELCKYGITVNCVCPGFFPSESNNPEAMEAMGPWINARTPMGRAGVEGELDTTIVYLAATESSYVNGAIISCDGGCTAV